MNNKIKTTLGGLLKKQAVQLLAIVLALSLIGGYTVFALAEKLNDNSVNTAKADTTESKTDDESVKEKLDSILDNLNADKQETVYVVAKADGTVKKVIVSELLKNENSNKTISDKTDLKDVKNVKNNNGYTMDGDSYIWDAEGNDVYYQGTTDKQLPVDLSIEFKLDGTSVSPEALAGKSGKLEMTFNYTNNEKKTVKIDGKDETIYVPFTMLSGLIIDNDKCKNLTVSNGRVISDGDRSIAVGFAMPGLQEDLDISKDKLDIPSSVTLKADVTDFELDTTLTLASNGLLNSLDLSNVKTYDDLKDKLKTLDDSAKQLMDGSSKLYGYLSTLLNKSGDLINGVQALAAGAQGIAAGTDTLKGGSAKLSDGAAKLYAGLGKLSQNSESLRAGSKQVFDTLLTTADTQIAAAGLKCDKLTIDNYTDVLNAQIKNLDESVIRAYATAQAQKVVTETVKSNEAAITTAVEQAVRQQVLAGVLKTLNMTVEQYEAGLKAGVVTDAQKAQIEGAVDAQMATDKIKATISGAVAQKEQELIDQNMKSDAVQKQINDAVATAKKGAESLTQLKAQLDSYNTFYKGLNEYTNGVDTAFSGSKDLKNGSGTLADGAATLNKYAKQLLSGMLELKDKSVTLVDAVKQITEGSQTLSDGMKKFYDEGIAKLMDTFDNKIDKVYSRLRATVDVSKDYDSFGGKDDSMTSSTKFIYRTEEISKTK